MTQTEAALPCSFLKSSFASAHARLFRLFLPGPAARWPAGMTFDSVRKRSVLFGGFNQTGDFGDTWELYDPNAKVGGS
jgi:hypothetical protein